MTYLLQQPNLQLKTTKLNLSLGHIIMGKLDLAMPPSRSKINPLQKLVQCNWFWPQSRYSISEQLKEKAYLPRAAQP